MSSRSEPFLDHLQTIEEAPAVVVVGVPGENGPEDMSFLPGGGG